MKNYKVVVLVYGADSFVFNIKADSLEKMHEELLLKIQRLFGSIEYKILNIYEA